MNNKGLTLIELICCLAILMILMLIAVPRVLAVLDNAKANAHQLNVSQLTRAAEMHLLMGGESVVWAPHAGTKAVDDYPVHDSWMKFIAVWPQEYRGQGYVVEISKGKVVVTP
jgi:prepilin-type N-terminal cleavage/methylation domain-containing protein